MTGATHDTESRAATDTEAMTPEEAWALLGQSAVGRIAFAADGLPVVFPVNFRVVDNAGTPWIILRVRPGHSIDHAPPFVAFEIDGIDAVHHAGWSVLVRGALHHLDEDEVRQLADPADLEPWPERDRTVYLWKCCRSRASHLEAAGSTDPGELRAGLANRPTATDSGSG